jgi:D-alanine-D-alanine ligase
VGVIGNESPRASVVGEIVPTHEFYDYEDKYLDGAAEMVIPADLPAEVVAEQARELALRAWRSRRCAATAWPGWTSSTRRPAAAGLLFNEINTMPGFTPYSMFPSLWAATGLPYAELIDELAPTIGPTPGWSSRSGRHDLTTARMAFSWLAASVFIAWIRRARSRRTSA